MSTNNKWQALSMKDRAFLIREAVRNGITDINSIRDTWEHRFDGLRDVVEKVNTSEKDFARRLRQEGRASIPDWEDPRRIATHKLSVATDENGIHYIYPDVQNIDNRLVDYSNPSNPHYTYGPQIAAERGDTIQVGNTNRDLRNAIKFTEKYKKLGIYPEFSEPPHTFDGESNQPTEEKPWYKKLASAISEGSRMARDARIGAVGAEQVRELYRKGENEKAQKQAEQYAHANIAGISAALGKTTDAILPNILNLAGAVSASALVSDGFKNNKESKPVIYPTTPADKIPSMRTAEEDMMQRIERVENKKNKKGGWNNKKRIWFAHDSYEGGAPTIGYGIKLNKGTKAREVFDRQGYLTESQEREFRTELMQNALRQAKKSYDKKFGSGQFDLLDFKAQSLLGDKEYNVAGGVDTFPKLMTAVYNNDIEEIKKQVITKAKKKGSKKFLTLGNRNDDFLQDIDSLKQGIYNIYKK